MALPNYTANQFMGRFIVVNGQLYEKDNVMRADILNDYIPVTENVGNVMERAREVGYTNVDPTTGNAISDSSFDKPQEEAKSPVLAQGIPERDLDEYIASGGITGIPGGSSSSSGSGGGSGSSGGLNLPSTGDPGLDQLTGELENYLNELEKRGQVLNPNIVLDEKTLAKFTKQAEQEINPYYSSQLKAARESLLYNTGYSRSEVLQNEADLERQYKTAFKQTGESAADRGFALSGIRQQEEGELATNAQNQINAGRRTLDFNTGNQARTFAQTYGTSNMPTLDISGAPSITGGETNFNRQGPSRSLYTLDPAIYDGLTGSQEFERRGQVSSRASQLEEAFRGNQALTQQRALTL